MSAFTTSSVYDLSSQLKSITFGSKKEEEDVTSIVTSAPTSESGESDISNGDAIPTEAVGERERMEMDDLHRRASEAARALLSQVLSEVS